MTWVLSWHQKRSSSFETLPANFVPLIQPAAITQSIATTMPSLPRFLCWNYVHFSDFITYYSFLTHYFMCKFLFVLRHFHFDNYPPLRVATSHLTSHFTSSWLHSSHFAFYPHPIIIVLGKPDCRCRVRVGSQKARRCRRVDLDFGRLDRERVDQ